MTSFAFTAFLLLLVLFALPLLLGFLSGRAYRAGRGRVAFGLLLFGGSWASWRGLGPWASSSSPWASPGVRRPQAA